MSIKTGFLILIIGWLFPSCSKDIAEPVFSTATPKDTVVNRASADGFYYLALGDSYTIGQSVAAQKRYPVQLGDSLFLNDDAKEVGIIATTGWTTDELKNGIAAANNLRNEYDLVSLLIGVNNQYRNYPLSTYKIEFKALLQQAIRFAGNDKTKVFVVSIPDYAYTPYGGGSATISNGIDEFNAACKAITEDLGVQFFDITPISREGLNDPDLVAADGLHPSGKQYTQWVELMLPMVRKMVK